MATKIRRWYVYNGASGGQQNHSNYFYISTFPNTCTVTATDICCILGVYRQVNLNDPSNNQVFGTNPQTFAQGTTMFNYLVAAVGRLLLLNPIGAGKRSLYIKRTC